MLDNFGTSLDHIGTMLDIMEAYADHVGTVLGPFLDYVRTVFGTYNRRDVALIERFHVHVHDCYGGATRERLRQSKLQSCDRVVM